MDIKRLALLLTLTLGCLAWVACIPPVHPDDFGDNGGDDDDAADDDAGDDDTGGGMSCGNFCSWESGECIDWGAMGISCQDYCDTSMDQYMLDCMDYCPGDPTEDGCYCLYACLGY